MNDGSQMLEIRRKTGENKNNSEDQNRFGQRRDSLKEKQTGQSFVRQTDIVWARRIRSADNVR